MANTRAKFVCTEVTSMVQGTKVKLVPVTATNAENTSFFKWTPSGSIEMGIMNPDVEFIPGKEYFVDFTIAE